MNKKKACGICGKEFSPKHSRQATCGDADCRRLWENQRKRGRDKKRRERLKKKGIDPNQRRRTECPVCGKRCVVGPLDDYCSPDCRRAGKTGTAWRDFYPGTKGLILKWSAEGWPVWRICQLLGRHHSQIEAVLQEAKQYD